MEKIDIIIGFQIKDINSNNLHPKMESQNTIYSLPQCMAILLKNNKSERNRYEIVHIFRNEIKNPILKFKGSPFTANVDLLITQNKTNPQMST